MSEPHYHDRIASMRWTTSPVPEDTPDSINMMFCPLFEGTDCSWEFIDPLPDGTHQLRYVKNTPTNVTPAPR